MSEVISFRLDKTNPRETQALEILNVWIAKGYSIRFILTKALLELDHDSNPTLSQSGRELNMLLDQIGHLLEIVRINEFSTSIKQSPDLEQPILREAFITSIKLGVKPGIKHG